jgi:hypothetical protein
MYDRQHGVEANLFLAPGEGGEAAAKEKDAPGQGAPGAPSALDMLRKG